MRLDKYLVSVGAFDSRQKAREAIEEGRVKLGGQIVCKPSLLLGSRRESSAESWHKSLEILGEGWVSRAGKKLQGFLAQCQCAGLARMWASAIDVGAARGGFSEVLLRYGVESICCVDVGRNQLHSKIATDSRVEVFEQCDIRSFTRRYARRFDIAVCDVSFISLGQIIDDLCKLSDELIILCKPQFEVGRAIKRNKRGVVQDMGAVHLALERCVESIRQRGFSVRAVAESILKGKEGNAEFFIYASRANPVQSGDKEHCAREV